ncbi:MAG: hypothetical protein P9L99_01665 [Candidatus Lernaella stagnicola]|nr:hypothetical protein [Candidatus Lernaella stagnicola]
MRTRYLLFAFAVALALGLACGTGDKPEFVEVPSADPQPPIGDGEPIQDAEGDPADACGEDQQALLPPATGLEAAPQKNPDPSAPLRQWEVLPKPQRQPQKKTVGDLSLLLIPLFAAVFWRRRNGN